LSLSAPAPQQGSSGFAFNQGGTQQQPWDWSMSSQPSQPSWLQQTLNPGTPSNTMMPATAAPAVGSSIGPVTVSDPSAAQAPTGVTSGAVNNMMQPANNMMQPATAQMVNALANPAPVNPLSFASQPVAPVAAPQSPTNPLAFAPQNQTATVAPPVSMSAGF
jgi:hypothetical protein